MRLRRWLMAGSVLAGMLLTSGPAAADPVSAAILGVFSASLAASTTAVAITTFALETVAGLGLGLLSKALGKQQQQAAPVGGTTGRLSTGGAIARSFLVGTAMTAGSLVYANTYGSAGGTPNAYLVQVIALSDLPITGLTGLFVNGEEVTWDPEATPETEGISIPEYEENGNGRLWVRFYDGSQTTADSRLVSLFGSDPDRPYTTSRVGYGVAYAVMTARIDEDLFSGFPTFKFVGEGVPLYDRRADDTAGGGGDQRWSDPTTWAFSANNAVMIENILRGIRYAGQWVYGAQTVAEAQLPLASWAAAQNECDTAIALAGGGTEPQFYAGGEISFDSEPADAIEELLKGCGGKLAEIGGTYKIRVGAAGAAVFSIVDGDIRTDDPQVFEPFPGLEQTVNAVTARYVSPGDGWVIKDAPPLYDDALEAEDGGRRQATNLSFGFVTSATMVQRLMRAAREEERAFRRHTLPLPFEAETWEPLDVVSWTSDRNGYSAKSFDVTEVEDLPTLDIVAALRELDPAAYDWDKDVDEQPVTTNPVVIIRPAAQAIADFSAEGVLVQNEAGLKRAGMLLEWDPDVDDVDGVQYQVRLASDDSVVIDSQTDFWDRGSLTATQNLLSLTAYEARARYRAASPRPTSWSGWLGFTTPDARVSSAELDASLDALMRRIEDQVPADLLTLRQDLDLLATSQVAQIATIQERLGRVRLAVGERIGAVEAGVELALSAAADAQRAIAAFALDLFAIGPSGAAEGLLRFALQSAPDGVGARFAVEVRASTLDDFATAGLTIDAGVTELGGRSRILLAADKIAFSNPDGSVSEVLAIEDDTVKVNGELILRDSLLRPRNFDSTIIFDATYTLSGGGGFGTTVVATGLSVTVDERTKQVMGFANFDARVTRIGGGSITSVTLTWFFILFPAGGGSGVPLDTVSLTYSSVGTSASSQRVRLSAIQPAQPPGDYSMTISVGISAAGTGGTQFRVDTDPMLGGANFPPE